MMETRPLSGEEIDAIRDSVLWVKYLTIFMGSSVAIWVWRIAKFHSRVEGIAEEVHELKEAEFLPKSECGSKQGACQDNTWNKIMLALEKRDREFDKKFATICAGIARVEQKVDSLKDRG